MRALVHRTAVSGAALALMLLFPCGNCTGQSMSAHFDRRETIITDTFDAGPEGGTFESPVRGLPTDGVKLQLPGKAVDRPIPLSLGYCKGEIRVVSGKPSGVVLTVGAAPADRFEQPLKISVTFPPSPKYQILVGYSIDAEGRFHTIDIGDVDMKQGRVTFLTFQPLTFTWVYVER
jgi:hypothetical protein